MGKSKNIALILVGLGLLLTGTGFTLRLLAEKSDPTPADKSAAHACVEPASVSFDAPDLSLQTVDQHPVNIDDLRGKTVLINAWATWCPPCLAELPDLEAFFRNHKSEDFILIGVNIGETRTTVSAFLESNPVSFPIWLDPNEDTLRKLNTISLPHSIVINPGGEVVLAWSGATCLEQLENSVTPILRQ